MLVSTKGRYALRIMIDLAAVSYTHLDVYKRQEQYLNITPGSVSVLGLMNDPENKVRLLIDKDIPVSYTHLDVYKRQPLDFTHSLPH